jgi:hypothetical protein
VKIYKTSILLNEYLHVCIQFHIYCSQIEKKIMPKWHLDGYAMPRLWDGPHIFVQPVAFTILGQIFL